MRIDAFKLETWFREHYFDTEIVLCVSGVEEYSIGELRELAHLSQEEMDSIVLLDSPSHGSSGIRQAIANRWIDGKVERVLVTHGSSEAMFLAMNALLHPGDEVVILTPCYQPLFSIPKAIGCQIKFWQLRPEQRFTPDLEALSRMVTSRTRMVVVNFPNNPTGITLTMEQQRELIRIVATHGAYLFWDAAFADLTYNTSPLPDPSTHYERTITINTLTKSYGLGGLRIGWCLADPDILIRCVGIRDYITLNLCPLIEYIAERVVTHLDVVLNERLKQAQINHKILTKWLAEHQELVECAVPQGGVSAFIKLRRIGNTEAFCQSLVQEQGVFLLPGNCFGHSEYVRLGFGRATSELVEGLSRISRLLTRFHPKVNHYIPPAPLAIKCSNRDTNIFPLSFTQQRLWFLEQLAPRHSFYNLPLTLRLCGTLDYVALEQSLDELIKRHETLRTTFTQVRDLPVQVIAPTQTLTIPLVDLRGLYVEQEAEFQRLATVEGRCPFDLLQGPLLRAILIQLNAQEHVLFLTIHHIICDGWSFNVLHQELSLLYQTFRTRSTSPLTPLPVQYADYTLWQRQWLQEEQLERHLTYWRAQLHNLPPLFLPTDYPRPEAQSFRGAQIRFGISCELTEQLRALSRQEGGTLFQTLLATFQMLLSRYSGAQDIVVGTPAANRTRGEIAGLIGCFINMLVLRTDLSGNPSLRDVLARVKRVVMEAKEHQDLPFEKLVERLQPERNLNQQPLFQVMITLRRRWMAYVDVGELQIYLPEVRTTQSSQVDLSLIFDDTGQDLQGVLEYATDLFAEETMQRLVGHLQVGLATLIANPEQRLSQLSLLTEAERQQVLFTWNTTKKDFSGDQCIHQLFEAQVRQVPDSVALVYEEQQMTYTELNHRANQLAHSLQSQGVGPEVLVGLCVERSVEMIVGLLGILKAGGAYVPLDLQHPQERLTFLLQDTQICLLLTQHALLTRLPFFQGQVLCLDHDWSQVVQQGTTNLCVRVQPGQLAYVIYTSGSTGKPKGVMVSHANVARLLAMTDHWFRFQHQDVWTMFHSFAFDFSVWEIWGALLYGGRLEVVPYWVSRLPEHFYAFLRERQVTVLNQTPSAFRHLQMVDAQRPDARELALRYLIFGGEALDSTILHRWFTRHGDQHPQLVNMYGITETTVHVTYQPLSLTDQETGTGSVIGQPISDLQCYVLDAWQQLAPVGIPGELYVSGRGMARGYWQRADLTAERFVPSPWSAQPGERLYKTGDLVRYRGNGVLEYLGRIDQQVKVRGYRIELGEIEAALRQHPAIHEALVLAHDEKAGDKYLVAYVVAQPEVRGTEAKLSTFLRDLLPDYMVPQRFVHVDRLPMTSNGKLNREALLALSHRQSKRNNTCMAPRTWIEEILVQIWQQVLKHKQIGIDENFFALGGHSLLAIQVISRVRDTLHVELLMRTIFEYPTIMELARNIEQMRYQLVARIESDELTQMLANPLEHERALDE